MIHHNLTQIYNESKVLRQMAGGVRYRFSEWAEHTAPIFTLPENTAKGQISAVIKGRTLKNELNYNRDTWEEWTNVGTQAIMLNGYLRILPNTGAIIRLTTKYKANTKYGLLVYIAQNTRTSYMTIAMSGTNDVFLTPAIISSGLSGYVKRVLQTKEEITTNRHYIYAPANEGIIDIGDIRVFELPTGSELEQDFETLPADQLAQKYPYIKGDSVKSTFSAMRLKSVGKNLFDGKWLKGWDIRTSEPTGEIYQNAGRQLCANFIKIQPSTSYVLSKEGLDGISMICAFYDSNFKYIDGTTNLTSVNTKVLISPINAAYVRFGMRTDIDLSNKNIQIERGTVATPYEPYTESTQYITAKDEEGNIAELRSLPNGVRDELIIG